MRFLYKYPQRGVPVRRPRRRPTGPREPDRVRVRAARHRRLRRRPLLRRRRRVRQGGARGPADPDHRAQPRARTPRRCTCCRRCGSATPGRGAPTAPKPAPAARVRRRRRSSSPSTPELGRRRLLLRRRRRRCCSPRTRRTPSGCSARRTRRRTSRTASTGTSSTATTDAVNPERLGTKAAAHYVARRPGRRHRPTVRLRLTDAPDAERRTSTRRRSTQLVDAPAGRGRRVLRRADRRPS